MPFPCSTGFQPVPCRVTHARRHGLKTRATNSGKAEHQTVTEATQHPLSGTTDTWELSRRVEAWAGEMRVNVIRILAIAIFYGRHLIELMLSPKDAPVRGL